LKRKGNEKKIVVPSLNSKSVHKLNLTDKVDKKIEFDEIAWECEDINGVTHSGGSKSSEWRSLDP
jgi:hypothetical protein